MAHESVPDNICPHMLRSQLMWLTECVYHTMHPSMYATINLLVCGNAVKQLHTAAKTIV